MTLVEHAEKELRLVGLLDRDSDYNGMLGDAVMQLVRTFANQEHSGMSAVMTLQLFQEVASYHALAPITDNPEEWMQVTDDTPLWQNRRQGNLFSFDRGKTWYSVDDPRFEKARHWWNLRARWWVTRIRRQQCRPTKSSYN